MDVLKVGQKEYVKASVIARDLGYTSDYVGQLCRGGKIDAKLVGRTWYVDKDSIDDHKSNRYRSTQTKSKEAITVAIKSLKDEEELVAVNTNSAFYKHSTLKPSPRYVTDESELLPVLENKSGKLRIDLADSSAVTVVSKTEKYTFNTPKLPQIKFKGSLKISEALTEIETEATDTEGVENKVTKKLSEHVIHPKEVTDLFPKIKAKNIVSSSKLTAKAHKKSTHQEEREIPVILADAEVAESVAVSVLQESVLEVAPSHYAMSIFVSVTVSCAVVVALLGLEAHVFITPEVVNTTYVFGVDNLLASVYESLK